MRIVVEIRREDEQPLTRDALREHRSVREHAAYLIHLKLQEIEAQAAGAEPIAKAS